MSWPAKFWLLLLLAVASGNFACGPHRVTLPRPPTTQRGEDRLQAFEQMRPRAEFMEVWLNEFKVVVRKQEEALVLNNGYLVEHPMDLVPWVAERSEVVHHAEVFQDRDRTARRLEIPVFVGLAAGLPLTFLGFQQYLGGPLESEGLIGGIIGVGALATSVIMYLLAAGPRADANAAKRAAFMGYELGLKEKLKLCDVAPDRRVPCEQLQPPKPSPPPVTPAPTPPTETSTGVEEALEPVDESEL